MNQNNSEELLRSAHPSDPVVREHIMASLADIGQRQHVTVSVMQPFRALSEIAERAVATLDTRREATLIAGLDALFEVKMRAAEAATSPCWPGIHAFVESELAANAADPVQPLPQPDTSALGAFLHHTVLHFDREAA